MAIYASVATPGSLRRTPSVSGDVVGSSMNGAPTDVHIVLVLRQVRSTSKRSRSVMRGRPWSEWPCPRTRRLGEMVDIEAKLVCKLSAAQRRLRARAALLKDASRRCYRRSGALGQDACDGERFGKNRSQGFVGGARSAFPRTLGALPSIFRRALEDPLSRS